MDYKNNCQDRNGNSVENAVVRIYPTGSGTPIAEVQTDSKGVFTFTGLTTGSYDIKVWYNGTEYAFEEGVELIDSAEIAGGLYTLEPVQNITALKALDISGVADKSQLLVEDENIIYRWDAESVLAENLPYIVLPNSAPASGRWFRLPSAVYHSDLIDDEVAKHRLINDGGSAATELFSASKIIADLLGKVSIDGSIAMTGDFDLGANHIINTDYMDFNSIAAPAYAQGRVYWDDVDKTLAFHTDISGVSLQIGHETFVKGVNKTGLQIDNGTVVYVNGAQGNRPTIAPAKADSYATSYSTIGLVTSDVADNAEGYVTTCGLVRGLNTSAHVAGTVLFLSETVAGEWTAIRPGAPNTSVFLGVVTTQHTTQGVIEIHNVVVQRMSWASDVNARGNQSEGDILYWDDTNKYWTYKDANAYYDAVQDWSANQTFADDVYLRFGSDATEKDIWKMNYDSTYTAFWLRPNRGPAQDTTPRSIWVGDAGGNKPEIGLSVNTVVNNLVDRSDLFLNHQLCIPYETNASASSIVTFLGGNSGAGDTWSSELQFADSTNANPVGFLWNNASWGLGIPDGLLTYMYADWYIHIESTELVVFGQTDWASWTSSFEITPASGVKVNTISEITTGVGVTIDSVLLKDGQVQLLDNKKVLFGTGADVAFYYDGVNLIFDNDSVADSNLLFKNTVWDDIRVAATSVKIPAANAPDWANIRDGLYTFAFDDAADEEVHFSMQLPHRYKNGTNLKAHIHWSPGNNVNTGNVTWKLEYTIISVDGTFGASATIDLSDVGDGVAYKHQMTPEAVISGTGLGESSMLIGRLYRDANDVGDTFVGDAFFLEFDCHYEVEKLGTKTSSHGT